MKIRPRNTNIMVRNLNFEKIVEVWFFLEKDWSSAPVLFGNRFWVWLFWKVLFGTKFYQSLYGTFSNVSWYITNIFFYCQGFTKEKISRLSELIMNDQIILTKIPWMTLVWFGSASGRLRSGTASEKIPSIIIINFRIRSCEILQIKSGS